MWSLEAPESETLSDPVNSQDVTTGASVDSYRSGITVGADEIQQVNNNQYEWSFDKESSGSAHD